MRRKVVYDAEFNTQEAEKNAENLNNKFKGASESAESIKENTDGAAKSTEKLGDESKKAAKETEGIDKAAKKSKGGVSLLSKGFKGLGMAMKAAGIGIIVAVVAKLTEAFSNNQAVLDGFNKVMETINIVFTQFTTAVTDAFEKVSKATGGFQSMTNVVKGLMTLALTPLKLIFDGIKLTIQQAQLAWEESFFGDNDPETIKGLKANIKDTQESIRETGEEAAQAGRQVADNFGGMIDELGQFYEEASKNVEKIDVEAAKSSADRLVQLRNEAELAEAQLAGLTLKFQQQAEVLRQERDDIRLSIEDRIKANEELGEVLEKQSEEELKLANKRLELAREELRLNPEKIENQKALQEALNGVAEVEERITGQKSEQRTNEAALLDERRANLEELERIGQSERELAELEAEQEAERQRELIERTVTEEARKAELLANVQSEFQSKITKINDEAENEKREAEAKTEEERKKAHKEELARAEAEKNAKIQVAQSILAATSSFLEQGSNAAKAVAVAQTTIDTYKSAQAAYAAMAGIPVIGPGLGIAAAAAAVAAGVANVRKIMQTNPEGGGATPSMGGMSAGGAGGALGGGVPNITAGQRQEAANVDPQEALRRQQNADNLPIQAYVLEGNITNSQEAQRQLENSARL